MLTYVAEVDVARLDDCIAGALVAKREINPIRQAQRNALALQRLPTSAIGTAAACLRRSPESAEAQANRA